MEEKITYRIGSDQEILKQTELKLQGFKQRVRQWKNDVMKSSEEWDQKQTKPGLAACAEALADALKRMEQAFAFLVGPKIQTLVLDLCEIWMDSMKADSQATSALLDTLHVPPEHTFWTQPWGFDSLKSVPLRLSEAITKHGGRLGSTQPEVARQIFFQFFRLCNPHQALLLYAEPFITEAEKMF